MDPAVSRSHRWLPRSARARPLEFHVTDDCRRRSQPMIRLPTYAPPRVAAAEFARHVDSGGGGGGGRRRGGIDAVFLHHSRLRSSL